MKTAEADSAVDEEAIAVDSVEVTEVDSVVAEVTEEVEEELEEVAACEVVRKSLYRPIDFPVYSSLRVRKMLF